MVIDQVKVFQEIPIYTISFNYNDEIANRFLKEVAALTGGEFHFYHFGCKDPTPPEAVQVRAWWAEKGVLIYLSITGWRSLDNTFTEKRATIKITKTKKNESLNSECTSVSQSVAQGPPELGHLSRFLHPSSEMRKQVVGIEAQEL